MGNHLTKSQPEKVTRSNARRIPPHNVRISFSSDCESAGELPYDEVEWIAELYIQTESIPRLLRDGICISPMTEVKNTGVMLENQFPACFKHRRIRHTRRYIFRQTDEHHAWTAHLFVMGPAIQPLAEFCLSSLRVARIAHCIMRNSENLLVYRYNAYYSGANFQTVREDQQEDQQRGCSCFWFRRKGETAEVLTRSHLQLPGVHKAEAANALDSDSNDSAESMQFHADKVEK